jgi:hypothetical protein
MTEHVKNIIRNVLIKEESRLETALLKVRNAPQLSNCDREGLAEILTDNLEDTRQGLKAITKLSCKS